MILREDWMHVELMAKAGEGVIAIPEGLEGKLDPEDDVWLVKQVGPLVHDCKVGDELILSGLGQGARFKYNKMRYYVCREVDTIVIMNRS